MHHVLWDALHDSQMGLKDVTVAAAAECYSLCTLQNQHNMPAAALTAAAAAAPAIAAANL